ncbi:unnamed protein product [Eruca vesicaria subsp. sativa]|uniref:Serpin domain-containing protein n=1 Tax=Eruca vesicaria subsp. sativa TaxID=29727 RepID=A0ABC8IU06_ERUVS|nr:unnamed protein product [Eruca vesicaria subsp. sativa]
MYVSHNSLCFDYMFQSFKHSVLKTEVADGEKLYVSSVLHKACIEVDEEGTEAVAVSIAVFSYMCYDDTNFVADHPFLFTVREDKSGVILFMGQRD